MIDPRSAETIDDRNRSLDHVAAPSRPIEPDVSKASDALSRISFSGLLIVGRRRERCTAEVAQRILHEGYSSRCFVHSEVLQGDEAWIQKD